MWWRSLESPGGASLAQEVLNTPPTEEAPVTKFLLFAACIIPFASALSLPSCKDSEGPEVVFEDQSELFPGFEFSTGLQPEGSPVQASFTVSAKGANTLRAVAVPSGSESSPMLSGVPTTGSIAIDGSFALVGELKIDVSGLPSYDGPIPGIDNVVIDFSGSAAFDPFAIGTSVSARADIPASRLPGIPLPGGIPGQLVLEIVEGSFVEVGFAGTCAGIDGMQASYAGTIARSGSLVIKPVVEVEVPIAGTQTFEIPQFTVDLALGSSDVRMTADVSEFGDQPEDGDHLEGSCEPTSDGAGGAGGNGEAGSDGTGGTGSGPMGGSGGSQPPQTQTVCLDQGVTVKNLLLTEGDAEFGGNGPQVTTSVSLTAMPGVVMIEACVEMRETVSNWTTGTGCETLFVDVENAGLVGDPWYLAQYTDTDTAYDDVLAEAVNIQGTSNLVTALSCMGDTAGNDICSATDGGCSLCSFSIGCFTIAKP